MNVDKNKPRWFAINMTRRTKAAPAAAMDGGSAEREAVSE